jgi:hypothetical protein
MKLRHLWLASILFLAACEAAPPPPPLAAPAPAPAASVLPAVTLLRQALGPSAAPAPGATLYLYLLIGSHLADQAKVLAAFNAYLCEIPRSTPAATVAAKKYGKRLGLYLVPVATNAAAARDFAAGDAQALMQDYDYPRANQMLVQLAKDGVIHDSDVISTGIYLAGFSAPLPQPSTAHAIYEISRLPTAQDVRQWMVAEQQSIELGAVAPQPGVTRVPPTLGQVFASLGQVVAVFQHITTPANAAETIPCR